MQAGRLRQRVTFQSKTETQDASTGDIQEDWADDFDWPAEFQPLGSKEFPTAWKRESEVTARFVMRYSSTIAAPTFAETHRIAYTPDHNASPVSVRYFDIARAEDPDGGRRTLFVEGVEVE